MGKSAKGSFAHTALGMINSMYHFERQYKGLSPEERLRNREERILPLVRAFFVYLKKEGALIAPKSKTGEAISYCINQEKYLRVFLTDGEVPMDNNAGKGDPPLLSREEELAGHRYRQWSEGQCGMVQYSGNSKSK